MQGAAPSAQCVWREVRHPAELAGAADRHPQVRIGHAREQGHRAGRSVRRSARNPAAPRRPPVGLAQNNAVSAPRAPVSAGERHGRTRADDKCLPQHFRLATISHGARPSKRAACRARPSAVGAEVDDRLNQAEDNGCNRDGVVPRERLDAQSVVGRLGARDPRLGLEARDLDLPTRRSDLVGSGGAVDDDRVRGTVTARPKPPDRRRRSARPFRSGRSR